MSHWNYRVIRKHHPETDSVTYHVHEVYYRDDGGIDVWTQEPVTPMGETTAELREDIRYFLQAFRRPVLEVQENDEGATLVSDDTDDAINDGHYFELMDRASVALDYVYQFLGSHPLMKKDERLQEVYEKAEESLAELYQRAGLLEFDRSSS
ncbi:MAG: hypothetical protein F4201_06170 [Nitrospira sp. SB0677_bin_15]|nr:hypothetical protein [Nitrospira sp. SB0667_bin_9]MYD32148.1 hypothetical protein [Nitrospira sp. SB0661_bin_20]MYG40379.1 hypothetical protein [Nitrospira sp. SB0677_bin_15]MYH02048.1 hypothetical protein [Nitrospira sp. SB0675_bin_23]